MLTPLLASTQFCQGLRLGRSWRLASRIAGTLTSFSIRHARPIAAVGLVGTLLLTAIGMQVDADNRVVDSLPRQAASSQALIAVDEEFGGVMGVDVVVHWPEGVSWRSDELLGTLNEVHAILNASDATSRPLSLASVTNSMPPRARRRLSADAVDEMIDPDARMAIVRARVRDAGSRQLERVYGNIDKKLSALAAYTRWVAF